MPHQLTITAPTGPNKVNTAAVIPNVQRLELDLADKTVQVYVDPPTTNVKEFDISAATVMTVAITTGNYAIVIS